jgi:hypothetical protein
MEQPLDLSPILHPIHLFLLEPDTDRRVVVKYVESQNLAQSPTGQKCSVFTRRRQSTLHLSAGPLPPPLFEDTWSGSGAPLMRFWSAVSYVAGTYQERRSHAGA